MAGAAQPTDPCSASTLTPGTIVEGAGFAASGGGYRAMLFHLGALWRLNELGWLPKINRYSGVSGGALTLGTLGAAWQRLKFDGSGVAQNFRELVADPIRAMAQVRLDAAAIARGLLPFGSGAEVLAGAYRKHLVGDATLQDLPAGRPHFTFNTTNVQTGADFRFTREYIRDYRVGCLPYPKTSLALAMAASSSFPPFLSPCVIKLRDPLRPAEEPGFDDERFRKRLVLSDGGVYDNLGLEPINSYRTIIASDAGSPGAIEAAPHVNWLTHAKRVADLAVEQGRRQRRRLLMDQVQEPSTSPTRRIGTLWKIDTKMSLYPAPADGQPLLVVDDSQSRALAAVSTRLWPFATGIPERVVNLGYALADGGLRSWMGVTGQKPEWPYPDHALSSATESKARPTAGALRRDRA